MVLTRAHPAGGGEWWLHKARFLISKMGVPMPTSSGILWGAELSLCLGGAWRAPHSQQGELEAFTAMRVHLRSLTGALAHHSPGCPLRAGR